MRDDVYSNGRRRPTVLVNLANEPKNKNSGITQYTFCLLQALIESDRFRYVLLTTWDIARLPFALFDKMKVIEVPAVRSAPLNAVRQAVLLRRLVPRLGADLVFQPNPLGPFTGAYRRVVTVHDLYMVRHPEQYARRHVAFWNFVVPRALARADAIIAVSHSTRNEIERIYPPVAGKCVVVHEAPAFSHSAATSEAKLPASLHQPYGLIVGNIAPNKNVDVIVEALARLAAAGHRTRFFHVGRDEAGLLSAARDRHPDANGPISVGFIEEPALVAAYRNATCFVNSSVQEGFCLPIIEAQRNGTAVVCSDLPVLREVSGGAALYFEPNDAVLLAEHIKRVFADDKLRAELRRRGIDNASKFSWTKAAQETEAVFENVLRGGS